ncbi:MAG: hypothetical protein NT113_22815 [Hyphomicrobiales bacterium]|nr:hypothetical protein [Hyphomicrobiales bacterium]
MPLREDEAEVWDADVCEADVCEFDCRFQEETEADCRRGRIFSNVKAGMVFPLVVELKHKDRAVFRRGNTVQCENVPLSAFSRRNFKHNLCQISATLPLDCPRHDPPIGCPHHVRSSFPDL